MSDPNDPNDAPNRCPMILAARGLAALYTEVNEGEYDGKAVMILFMRKVMPDGADFKVGFSEEAVDAVMARCIGFKRHLARQRKAIEEGRDNE